jgi:diguanylate cyclase (GGDEF)-like protein
MTSYLNTGSQSRREAVRQVTFCRALLRVDESLSLRVIITDFCSGGLLLLQQDHLQPSIDTFFQRGTILELRFQEEGLPTTPVSIKCVRAEKNALGVQFVRDSRAHVNALIQFNPKNQLEKNTQVLPKNNLNSDNTAGIFERITNMVVSYLDTSLAKFFKLLMDVKQDADFMMNIQGMIVVNEVIDFLKMHADSFTNQCIEENLQFFKNYRIDPSVQKTVSVSPNTKNLKLSLVDKDDFEEWLSIKLVTNKAESEIKEELQIFLIRLSYLFERNVEASSLPFSPEILCERVRVQILLSSVRPPKILINKIFNVFYVCVLNQASALLQQLNSEMSASGCLPDAEVYKYLPAQSLDNIVKTTTKSKPSSLNKKDLSRVEALIENISVEKLDGLISSAGARDSATNNIVISGLSNTHQMQAVLSSNSKNQPLLNNTNQNQPVLNNTNQNQLVLNNTNQNQPLLNNTNQNQPLLNNANQNQPVLSNTNQIQPDFHRPEQSVTKYPLSESLSHARFLSSKAVESVNYLLSLQQALLLPQDIRKSQQVDAEYGVSLVDVMSVLKKLQFDASISFECLDVGLRVSIEARLKNGYQLTTQQLLSLSVVEKLFLTLKENVEFDITLHDFLNPLSLLVFKALLLDDSLLRNSKHPVREVINAIAFLGCRAGSNIRSIKAIIKNGIKILLRDFDQDNKIFTQILPDLDEQMSKLLTAYLRNLQKIQSRFDGTYKVERARKSTSSAIDALLLGKRVSPLLLEILETDFFEALFLAYVKQGANSKFWRIGLLAIEELAVITATHNADWDLLKIHPDKLFNLVHAAFNSLPNKKEEKTRLLQRLNQVVSTRQVTAESELVKYKPMLLEAEKIDEKKLKNDKFYDRITSIKVGDALCLKLNDKPDITANCAWIAPDRSRYVFVDSLGVIIGDYTVYEVSEKFRKRQWRLSGTDDLSVFDQGLDVLIEKIYTELTQSTLRDELTGVLNRKGFERELDACLRSIRNGADEHVMAYFTLNQFDILNNSAGYDAGDHFLKYLTQKLLTKFNERIVLARLGGTDFGLLLKYYDETEALRFVEDLLDVIHSIKFEWNSKIYRFGVSFGVLVLHEGYMDASTALHDSQSAAFIAKDRGGRHIHVVNNKNDVNNLDHISSWVTKIDEVIADNALRLRIHKIQFIQENSSDVIVKPHYEVLLSVLDGDQVLEPFEFICAAERYQRMGQVDCWVIKTLFDWLIANQEKQAEIGLLSINLSGHSLNDGQVMKYIFEAFASSKIACEKICFEITETVALTDLDDIVDFMVELKNLGCKFALDDFGTGSSSYQYLKRLPVDFIKIDGSFVRDMTRNRQDWAMVKSITDMGHLMGINVIAEYVEDEETLNELKIIGVDYAQGYYIEKPKWM